VNAENKKQKEKEDTQMKQEGKYIQKFIKRTVNGLRNQRVGVIVAALVDGQVKYGWCLAKVRPSRKDFDRIMSRGTDEFDEVRGVNIALSRLEARNDIKGALKMPDTVRSQLRDRLVQVKEFIKDEKTGKTKSVRTVKVVRGFENRAKKYFHAI